MSSAPLPLAARVRALIAQHRGGCALALLFVASRAVAYARGLRFDASPATYFVQIMDVELLLTDLLRTIAYAHTQPPLYNLLIGLVLKAFAPDDAGFALVFGLLYGTLGLLQTLALYGLGTALGARPAIAFAVAAIHMLLPTTLQYENWLLYSHPVACLVVLAAFLFERALATARLSWTALFFACLAALSLARLTFNWMWFTVCAAAFFTAAPRARRAPQVAIATTALLLVLAPVARHYALFGAFTTGDVFVGGSLSLKLKGALDAEKRRDLASRGRITPLFDVGILEDLEKIKPLVGASPPSGVPVLDRERKSTGATNFNNPHYRTLALRHLEEARHVIADYPAVYLGTIAKALYRSCARAGGDAGLPRPFGGAPDPEPSWTLLVAFPLLITFGLRQVLSSERTSRERFTVAILIFNVLFPTLVTCAISYGDFARYRFEVDGNYVVLLMLALSAAWTRLAPPGRATPVAIS